MLPATRGNVQWHWEGRGLRLRPIYQCANQCTNQLLECVNNEGLHMSTGRRCLSVLEICAAAGMGRGLWVHSDCI